MKTSVIKILFVVVAAYTASALTASAQILLNVDFAGTVTADSFQDFNAAITGSGATQAATQSFVPTTSGFTTNSITVTLGVGGSNAGGMTTRNRGNTLFPSGTMTGAFSGIYSNFYRANAFNTAGNFLTLTLTGLNPNTTYSLAWQSFDADTNSGLLTSPDIQATLVTGTSATTTADALFTSNVDPSASITNTGANAATGLFASVTSNASGTLSFNIAALSSADPPCKQP